MASLARRGFLAGLAAGVAAPALARAGAAEAEPVAAILARSALGEVTGFALTDVDGAAPLEAHRAEAALPPASAVKILTALYALDALGADFAFTTRLVATGPVADGVLRGDLALVGGGDPLLDTDALGDLAAALAAAGVRGVAGRFLVTTGALPAVAEIDPGQPLDAGYNPTVSGMNLNFNRVHLAWEPGADGLRWRFSAPGARFDPDATGFALELGPGLDRRTEAGREVWTFPAASLTGRGAVWLPTRAPGPYAGEVFHRLAASAGVALPPAETVAAAAPEGEAAAAHRGPPLAAVMDGMLHHSTNLTAEVAGLAATAAREGPADTLAASAAAMAGWSEARYGVGGLALVNHSGLTDASRMSPAAMTRVLEAERGRLPGLLRERPILDAERRPVAAGGARLLAKTGTLYFASALAGYLETAGGRRLAFAIFAADLEARARVPDRARGAPPGAKAWTARARAQEQALLRRWLAVHG